MENPAYSFKYGFNFVKEIVGGRPLWFGWTAAAPKLLNPQNVTSALFILVTEYQHTIKPAW